MACHYNTVPCIAMDEEFCKIGGECGRAEKVVGASYPGGGEGGAPVWHM